MRAYSRFSSVEQVSHAGMESGRGVSFVSAGMMPRRFWFSNVSRRCSSQPLSNLPLYRSAHSGATWWGACPAPGAQYMKNGLSGAAAFCWPIHSMALSAMASERCQPGVVGVSIGVVFS